MFNKYGLEFLPPLVRRRPNPGGLAIANVCPSEMRR
jgi:hypothetical protein